MATSESDKNQKMSEERKYLLARELVRQMKIFYLHLAIYVCVNVSLILTLLVTSLVEMDFTRMKYVHYLPTIWGAGVSIHAIIVFSKGPMIKKWEKEKITDFVKDWEEKKVKEIMENE
ncbi:MAG: histidine kinase [Thermoplasmata archaeon HGW-Thermoplasmata-1]|nr:MAG: histidine kinase [Thermoplasmata archaeon HGW-Thermoplasmata-1]